MVLCNVPGLRQCVNVAPASVTSNIIGNGVPDNNRHDEAAGGVSRSGGGKRIGDAITRDGNSIMANRHQ